MRKTMFVLDKLDLGGLQKVNVTVANSLGASIYSIQREPCLYDLSVPLYYGETGYLQKTYVKLLKAINLILKVVFKRSSEMVIAYQVKNLVSCIKCNDIETVVLSGPAFVFVPQLKKHLPKLRCVIWAHSPYASYEQLFSTSYMLFVQCQELADSIVCLTEYDKVSYGEKAKVINNPLTIINREHSDLSKKIVCFVGRISLQNKGLDYLCVVAKSLPEGWKISVAGSGNKNDESKFQELIDRFDVREKFILRGALSGEELRLHYLNSSIYVMTSRWEGFGLVLVEAMSFGLPIVSFAATGPREVLKDGEYGMLVDIGETEAFSDAVKQLIFSKEERLRWGAKSLERVKDFEIEDISFRWKEMISLQ